jgi:hypothetical protein
MDMMALSWGANSPLKTKINFQPSPAHRVTLDANEAVPLLHHSDIFTAHADDDIDRAGLVIPSPVEASSSRPVSSAKKMNVSTKKTKASTRRSLLLRKRRRTWSLVLQVPSLSPGPPGEKEWTMYYPFKWDDEKAVVTILALCHPSPPN